MKTKAAVVYEFGKPIEIEELDLDGPAQVAVGAGPPAPLGAGLFTARRDGDGWSLDGPA